MTAAAVACGWLHFTHETRAAVFYWDGETSSSWNVNTNWTEDLNATVPNPAAVPGLGGATSLANDQIVFNAATAIANQIATLDAAISVNKITFSGNATTPLTIAAGTGGSLSLGNGGIQIDAGSVAHTISANVTLGAAQTWTNNSTSPFTVSGTLGLVDKALTFDGAGDINISGVMSGTGVLTKNGTGTLSFLTADPSATGAMTINAGKVVLNHSGANDFNITINSTGTLQTLGANLGDSVDVTVNTGGVFDFSSSANDTMGGLSGAGTVTRTVATAATLTVGNGGEITTFSGVIQNGSGTVNFSKTGTGTLTLTGQNTFTGTLSVVNGSATAGNYSLVISGDTGAVATTTINVGDNNGGNESLRIGSTTDVWTISPTLNRIADTATITLSGTASTNGLAFHGPATGSSGNVETIGSLAVNLGRNYVTLLPGTDNELQVTTGALTRTGNGTLFIRGENLGGTGVGSTRLVVSGAGPALSGSAGADGTVSKSIVNWVVGANTATGAATGFLTHDPTNGLRLLTAAEYDSTVTGSGASLRNVSVAGGETVNSNEVINSLRITGGSTTIADGVRVRPASGAVLFTAASSIDGAGGYLDFGTAQGIIHVSQNTAAITATINSRVAGTGGLAVGSVGDVNNILVLAGENTVVGTLVVNSGILRAGSSGAFNDNFAMTVLARAGTTVQLFGNNVTLRDLQGGSGTGIYQNGAATAATLTTYLTGARSLTTALANGGTGALNLVVSGNTLTLNAGNTYTGTTEIRSGTITLSGNNTGHIQSSSSVTVYGGTLRLTNTSGNVLNNRINNSGTTNLIAGTFDFDNSAASGVAFSEADAGALALVAGANTVTVDRAASGQTSTVTFDSLSRTAGATVNFTSQNNGAAVFDLGTTTQSRLVFTAAPTLDDGILGGWATTNSSATQLEFVKYVTSGVVSVTALTGSDYTMGLASGANATQNVKINASPAALTSSTQINSLNVQQASATTVDLGGNTLRVESGGIIVSGDFNSSFINGNLTAGTGDNTAGELIFHTVGAVANPVVIDAVITDNGSGSVSLVKTGAGVLDLQGVTNTYTGKTTVNGGVLRIDSDANLGTAPGAASAGHLTLMGGARLDIMQSFTLNANRSMVIGPGVNTINITSGTAGQGKTLTYNGSITNFGTGEGSLTIESNAPSGVDVGEFNGTLSALNLGGTFRFEAGVITVNGATSEIGRSLQLAMDGNATLTYASSGGSLKVGQGINEVLDIGVSSSDVLSTTGILDVSALQSFRADVATIRLGIGSAGFAGKGTMLLASNNEITAGTSILISNSTGTGQEGASVQSSIRFGEGTSSVMTPLMTVGGLKGNGKIDIEAGGTLKMSGFGQRTMTLRVGSNVGTTGTLSTGVADISNGTLIGDFDTIVIGEKFASTTSTNVGGADGTLTLGTSASNAVETNTLVLGTMTGAVGTAVDKTTAQGEVSMGGGSFIVHGDVSMGLVTGTVGTARGDLTITGGTFTVGGNIVKTDSDRSSAVITLNGAGAVLDMRNDAYDDATKGTISASQLIFLNGSIVDTESATLDGRDVTDGNTFGNADDALVLRDVTVDFDVLLTNATAGLGGILYENDGGGIGAVISGDLNLGTVSRDIDVEDSAGASADLTVSGQITNTGSVNKQGAGTLVFSNGTNNYQGTTTVSQGTLQVGASGVGSTGTGATTVLATGTLAGTGTVTGAAATHLIQGTLRPGDLGGAGTGNLNFQGNLTMDTAAASFFQLGSPTSPGTTYDRITGLSSDDTIIVDGTLNAAEGDDSFFGGYVGAAGDTWMLLMDWTTINLAGFDVGTNFRTGADGLGEGDLDLPTLGSGLMWDISLFSTNGTIRVLAVPEPGRAMLLLLGAAGVVLRRRRTRE